jgi:hypothetical protein
MAKHVSGEYDNYNLFFFGNLLGPEIGVLEKLGSWDY